ncbi:MAG: Lrp/AsnC family transcriptional regulator [Clostridia bacterium]|nr:Lrp/AsnC family transcriptional regulator [Clostridia bacterium]
MDSLDYEILKILKDNGRMSHEQIAKEVNMSRPAVRARIMSMEEQGIIEGYSTKINYDLLGFNIQVFVYIKVRESTYAKTMAAIHAVVPEQLIIEDCFRISGEWCLLLRVMCHSQHDITEFVDGVLRVDNVMSTNTVFIFKS